MKGRSEQQVLWSPHLSSPVVTHKHRRLVTSVSNDGEQIPQDVREVVVLGRVVWSVGAAIPSHVWGDTIVPSTCDGSQLVPP
jgi:hypothetical protein